MDPGTPDGSELVRMFQVVQRMDRWRQKQPISFQVVRASDHLERSAVSAVFRLSGIKGRSIASKTPGIWRGDSSIQGPKELTGERGIFEEFRRSAARRK